MKKILFLLFFIQLIACTNYNNTQYSKLEGLALGTTFNIIYQDKSDFVFKKQIDSLIHLVNKSMSTYIPNSDISKINKGDTTIFVDNLFQEVFNKSNRIYRETNGFFDPTIGILVNAWGFGPDEQIKGLDSLLIINMLKYVGFDKVKIENKQVIKKYSQTYIDFNAIAKGFAVDVIGRFLEQKGINNYLIEIGGEIRVRGLNQSQKLWSIAIEKPNFDGSRSFQTKIDLNNESLATSGNYRKFKIDSITGKKYAHTIDTKTGYPSKSNLLSASVIAKLDCADVDGYATALMAMGFKDSKQFLQKHPELKAFLIYSDEKGEIKTYKTENLKN